MSDEMFYICEWCPEEYCGKTKHELVIVDGKRICYECMEAEYSEEPEHEVFVPAHETRIADLERQLADAEVAVAKYEAQSTTNFWRAKKAEQQLAESQASEKEWLRLSKELGAALASLRKAIEKHKHTIHEKCPEDTLLWASLDEQNSGN